MANVIKPTLADTGLSKRAPSKSWAARKANVLLVAPGSPPPFTYI
jgi:hypothetical protein